MKAIRHPSGRPIRPAVQVKRPIWRIPDREYATPRLRETKPAEAIGFCTPFLPGHQSTEDKGRP